MSAHDVLADAVRNQRIVGGVVIVRDPDGTWHRTACGLADRGRALPMPVDAIFRLSSLTKPIVAMTVLAMVEQGTWSLDDKISDYLPDFCPQAQDGTQPAISLHHLLTHTSGITSEPPVTAIDEADPAFIAAGGDRFHLSLKDAVQRLCRTPLQFSPGEGWAYSWGLDVLGAAIETITGARLGEAVQRLVTGPLGMKDTAFYAVDPSRLVIPYADSADGSAPRLMLDRDAVPNRRGGTTYFYPARIHDRLGYHHAGGGMAGTVDDFMKMLDCLARGGSPLISANLLKASLANAIPSDAKVLGKPWGFSRLGAVQRDPQATGSTLPQGTNWWGGIFGHSWAFDPTDGRAVVALTNTGVEGWAGQFPEDIRRAVFGPR